MELSSFLALSKYFTFTALFNLYNISRNNYYTNIINEEGIEKLNDVCNQKSETSQSGSSVFSLSHPTAYLVDYETLYKYGDLLLPLWNILPKELHFALIIVGSNIIIFKGTEAIAPQCIFPQHFIVNIFKHTEKLKYFLQSTSLSVYIHTYYLDSIIKLLLYWPYLSSHLQASILYQSILFVMHFKMS